MAGFKYQALDTDGKLKKGVIESDSARQVRANLREQGLIPVEVDQLTQAAKGISTTKRIRGGLSVSDLSLLTRQLATLLSAGLTIEQTLNALIEQAEVQHIRQILAGVRGEVLAGQPLARAMGHYESVFPDLYRTLVDAGEQSGQLAPVLLKLADYTEERQALRQKVGLAFVYPAIVTLVAILVVTGLLTYVVPQVVQVFQHTNQALPLLTRGLIALSGFLRTFGIYLLGALFIAAWFAHRALQQPAIREQFHQLLLRLPVIGKLTRGLNTARLASTLAILVGSRVPLLTSLKAGVGVVTNLPMKRALEETQRMVREGSSLSRALGSQKAFPPMMVHLIASGEASGRLPDMLERASKAQTREVETRIATLVSLLEPLLILAMGVIVLVIVLAILLPIMELNTLVK
ncbi:MAG: type II secretion system inner membrane protein GspF [Pseudomonadota bacterium]